MISEQADHIAGMLAAAFPVPARPAVTIALFAEDIEDLDHESAMAAAREWRRTRREHPAPSDLREMARAHLQKAELIPGELEPDEANGFLQKCFVTVGRYQPFPATYPLVAEVVNRMGWESLCSSDNLEATRAHFLQLYRPAFARAKQERLSAPALRLPTDSVQLEQQRTPIVEVPRKALPATPGPVSTEAISDVIKRLGMTPPQPSIEAAAPPTEFRAPTEAEIEAADVGREKIRKQREQLIVLGGGKRASA